jgi:hypothetical protein
MQKLILKNAYLFLLAIIMLVAPRCQPANDAYEVSYIEDFEIPGGTINGFITELSVDSRRDYWLSKHNIAANAVDKVEVKYVRFTILLSNDNFAWVDKGYLKIGKDATTPSYFEIGFNLQPNTTQNNYLDLAPDLTELKDYFLADRFKLQVKLLNKLGVATTAPLQVRLSLGMSVFKK